MEIVKLYHGPAFDVYGLVKDGVCQANEYIDGLDDSEQTRMFALIYRILHHGPPHNKRKFRHIGEQIYELKTSGGARILSFYGGDSLPKSLILALGLNKPKPKILDRQKKKVVSWREPNIEFVKDIEKLNQTENGHENGRMV